MFAAVSVWLMSIPANSWPYSQLCCLPGRIAVPTQEFWMFDNNQARPSLSPLSQSSKFFFKVMPTQPMASQTPLSHNAIPIDLSSHCLLSYKTLRLNICTPTKPWNWHLWDCQKSRPAVLSNIVCEQIHVLASRALTMFVHVSI